MKRKRDVWHRVRAVVIGVVLASVMVCGVLFFSWMRTDYAQPCVVAVPATCER